MLACIQAVVDRQMGQNAAGLLRHHISLTPKTQFESSVNESRRRHHREGKRRKSRPSTRLRRLQQHLSTFCRLLSVLTTPDPHGRQRAPKGARLLSKAQCFMQPTAWQAGQEPGGNATHSATPTRRPTDHGLIESEECRKFIASVCFSSHVR